MDELDVVKLPFDSALSEEVQDTFQQRYNVLFNSIAQGFGICEMLFDDRGIPSDYRFLEVNSSFASLVDLEPHQLVGNTAHTVFPNFESGWVETFGEVVSTGKPVKFDRHFAHLDRWYEIRAFVIDDPQLHRFGILYRERRDRRYQALFDSIDRGFCLCEAIFDDDGRMVDYRFLEINHLFEAMTGLVEAEGKTARELVPGLEDFWFDTYGTVVKTGKSIRFENEAATIHRWYEVTAFPVGVAGGNGFGILFADISDRKRKELNTQFLGEIQDELVVLADPKEIMVAVGEKIRRFFGFSLLTFSQIDVDANTARGLYDSRDANIPTTVTTHNISDYFGDAQIESMKAGETIAIADMGNDPNIKDDGAAYSIYHVNSAINVPYLSKGKWKFLMSGGRREASNWRADELELMYELSARIYPRLERAFAEIVLQEKMLELEALLDVIPVGIAIAEDPNWESVRVNSFAQEVLAVAPDILAVGDSTRESERTVPFRMYRNGRELDGSESPLQLAAKGMPIKDLEIQIVRADGVSQDWLVNATPLLDRFGQVRGSVAAIADVTKLKQIEADLRQTEEFKDRILESSPDCIKLLDLEGQILYMNAGGMALLEIDDFSSYQNSEWLRLWQGDYQQLAEQAIAGAKAGEVSKFSGYRATTKGAPKWWEVVISPLRNADDRVQQLLVSARDVSDRHRQELNDNFLAEIQKDLNYLSDPMETMSVVGEKMRCFFNFSLLVFADIDADADRSTVVYNSREADVMDAVTSYYLPDYLSNRHLEQLKAGNTVAIADTQTDPDAVNDGAAFLPYDVRSEVLIPYLSDGKWKFVLGGNYREPHIWRTDELELLVELTTRLYLCIERTRVETALQQSNQRFERAMQAVDGIVYEWHLATDRVYRSAGLFKLIGIRAEDAMPTKEWWMDRIHPEDRECLEQIFTALPPDSDRLQQEYRVLHADGRWIDVWDRSLLVRNSEGEIISVVGSITDISDRKFAERKLRESEKIYRAIGEALEYGIWINDVNGQNIYASASFLEMVGITQEQCNGLDWSKYLHPEEGDRTVQAWLECVRTEGKWDWEHRYLGTDGEWHPILARGVPVRGDRGEITCWAGINLDISNFKRTESALKHSEERYRNLVELIPQIVWSADGEGKALDINQRWLDFTGTSDRAEIRNLGLRPYFHPEDVDIIHDCWMSALQKGIPLQAEARLRRHDGVYRWYLHQAIPIKNDRGEITKWFGTGTDIDEQKQLEQQYSNLLAEVQERNQELDQFSHIVSHDLKAPLRAIANLSQWIEDDIAGLIPTENQEQLQLMRSRVYRMEAMISGLLNYARVAREDIPTEAVCIEKLLSEIIDSLNPPSTFTIAIVHPLPTLTTKRILLDRVLANLVGNAIKHHDRPDGKVKISVEAETGFYRFKIADDGKGIASSQQARIFDIFQTIEGEDRQGENTGIGLAIVKKIVETEGGKIQLTSELGKGSTFSFTWRKS